MFFRAEIAFEWPPPSTAFREKQATLISGKWYQNSRSYSERTAARCPSQHGDSFKIGSCIDIIRTEPQRLFKFLPRLDPFTLLQSNKAQVVVRLGKIRPQSQGLLKSITGLFVAAQEAKCDTQIHLSLGKIGPEAHRLLKLVQRFLDLTLEEQRIA